MLPEAGATELIFIAAVALIVVGPKDLPALLRRVGQFTAKMRGLAAEFRASFDELARQSELDELRKEVEALRTGQYVQPVRQEIDQHFDELHREFGAPPPPALTDEGVVIPGPNVMTALPAPEPAAPVDLHAAPPTLAPPTLSQAPEAVRAPATEPSPVPADAAREAAG